MQLARIEHQHSAGVTAASLAVAAASVFGFDASSKWTLALIVVATAVIGVPHGGLDHWSGRDLLQDRIGAWWVPTFFGVYLIVALSVASGWLMAPIFTAVGFFLISAWHFGMEDEDELSDLPYWSRHLVAVAVGGLVIWVPSVAQSERMSELLQLTVPSQMLSVADIMSVTQMLASILLPIAVVAIGRQMRTGSRTAALRNLALVILFAVADPLISFALYFCGWHSVRGLRSLAVKHRKTAIDLALATAPMTLGAIAFASIGWYVAATSSEVPAATIRTLFISLSAIAVPHLLLHGPIAKSLNHLRGSSAQTLELAR